MISNLIFYLSYFANDKEETENIRIYCADALVLIFIEVGMFLGIREAISMAVWGGIMIDRKRE